MQHQVTMTVRGVEKSAALEAHVRQRCEKLEQYFPHLIGTVVTLGFEEHNKQHGNHYAVKLVLQIPGNDIVIDNQQHEDAYLAVRDAFDAATRKLKAFAARNRGSDRSRRRTGTDSVSE